SSDPATQSGDRSPAREGRGVASVPHGRAELASGSRRDPAAHAREAPRSDRSDERGQVMRASITRDAPITPHEITSAGPSAEQQPDGPRRITPTLADAILSEVEDDVAQDGWLWVDGLIVIIEGNDDADL